MSSRQIYSASTTLSERELETLLGFIIDGPNLNNIRYTNGTVLMAVSVEKLQDNLNKLVEESDKKDNYKKTESMMINTRKSPRCELQIVNVNTNQVQKFKHLESILTEGGKCDTHLTIERSISKAQQIAEIRKNITKTKKGVLNYNVISIILYNNGC